MHPPPTMHPVQVSPQWVKSADRTAMEVQELVMHADTSGDGLLDVQEVTVRVRRGTGLLTAVES